MKESAAAAFFVGRDALNAPLPQQRGGNIRADTRVRPYNVKRSFANVGNGLARSLQVSLGFVVGYIVNFPVNKVGATCGRPCSARPSVRGENTKIRHRKTENVHFLCKLSLGMLRKGIKYGELPN